MSEKLLGACRGVKIEDSLTKEPFFCPTVQGSSPGVELMGRRAEDADEPTKQAKRLEILTKTIYNY